MTNLSQDDLDQKTLQVLADAVSKAINDNEGNKRFIDLERIPLICLSMSNMSKALDEIKEMIASNRRESDSQHESFVTKGEFTPYKKAMNMIGALTLVAVVGALLSLVVMK